MPHVDCVLIDGNNLAHRAWHASGASQYPASVTFTQMVTDVLRIHTPRYACVAFDSPNCFRKALLPSYKAHRAEKADALDEWLEALRGLSRISGARVNTALHHEADDVLATLSKQARAWSQERLTCLLCTSDRDAYALIGGPVAGGLVSSKGYIRYVAAKHVRESLGVEPWQVPLYKSLVGDASDNVPGVPNIGPKRAAALLADCTLQQGRTMPQYLESVLERLTSPPVKGDLEEGRRAARLAYTVLRLRFDAPVRYRLEACTLRDP